MAINQNHLFEDIDGVKCAIVEKNADDERIKFLRPLLEFNGFKVLIAESPPPKAPVATETEAQAPVIPTTFTVGVTDVSFNVTNAIFGRLLKTPDGRIVTLAYWNQKDKISDDSVPYFGK